MAVGWGPGRQDQAGSWQGLGLEEPRVTSASPRAPDQPSPGESPAPPAHTRIQPHAVPEVCPGVQHLRRSWQCLCSTHTHSPTPLEPPAPLFLSLIPETLDVAENKFFNWFLGEAAATGHCPVPSCCHLHQGPVAVPRGATLYPQSCSPKGPVPVGRAGHSSAAQGTSTITSCSQPPSPWAGQCHLWAPWRALVTRTLSSSPRPPQWDGFGVPLCPVPALPAVLCWSRRQVRPRPLPLVCVSPAHGGQARVACPLNGLQQQQVLGKAKRAGSRCCKGSSSARTNPAPLHPG